MSEAAPKRTGSANSAGSRDRPTHPPSSGSRGTSVTRQAGTQPVSRTGSANSNPSARPPRGQRSRPSSAQQADDAQRAPPAVTRRERPTSTARATRRPQSADSPDRSRSTSGNAPPRRGGSSVTPQATSAARSSQASRSRPSSGSRPSSAARRRRNPDTPAPSGPTLDDAVPPDVSRPVGGTRPNSASGGPAPAEPLVDPDVASGRVSSGAVGLAPPEAGREAEGSAVGDQRRASQAAASVGGEAEGATITARRGSVADEAAAPVPPSVAELEAQLEELRRAVAERDGSLATVTEQLAALRRQVAAERGRELTSTTDAANLSGRLAALASAEEKLTSKAAAVAQQETLLAAREKYVHSRTEEMVRLTNELSAKEGTVGARLAEADEKEATLEAMEVELRAREEAAAAAEAAVAQQEVAVKAREEAVAAEAAVLEERAATLEPREEAVAEAEKDVSVRLDAVAEREVAVQRLAVGIELREREMAMKRAGLATILDAERRLERARVMQYAQKKAPRELESSFGPPTRLAKLPGRASSAARGRKRPATAGARGPRVGGVERPASGSGFAATAALRSGVSSAAAATLSPPRNDSTKGEGGAPSTALRETVDRLAILFASLARTYGTPSAAEVGAGGATDPAAAAVRAARGDTPAAAGSGAGGNAYAADVDDAQLPGDAALRGVLREEVDQIFAKERAFESEYTFISRLQGALAAAERDAAALSSGDCRAPSAPQIVAKVAEVVKELVGERSGVSLDERAKYLTRGIRVLARDPDAADEMLEAASDPLKYAQSGNTTARPFLPSFFHPAVYEASLKTDEGAMKEAERRMAADARRMQAFNRIGVAR